MWLALAGEGDKVSAMNTENTTNDSGVLNKILQYRTVIIVSLVCLGAIGAVLWLAFSGGGEELEVIEEGVQSSSLNTAQIIDAINGRNVTAQEGYRYKVVIEDESDRDTSGIARIGGLVTFVEGSTSVGDVLIVEVTRVTDRVANAVVIEKLGTMEVPKRSAGRGRDKGTSIDGKIYSGIIEDVGSKGDGIIHIDGKVTFVEGTAKGDDVKFIITYQGDRMSAGRVISDEEAKEMGGEVVKVASGKGRKQRSGLKSPIEAGAAYRGVIEDVSRQNDDGIMRIAGKIVFIPDTKIGDEVVIIIEEDRARVATGRKLSASEQEGLTIIDASAVASSRPAKTRSSSRRSESSPVKEGQAYKGIIEDIGSKGDGLLHIGKKVVFVPGTEKGEEVVFIVEADRGRIAIGRKLSAEEAAGVDPLDASSAAAAPKTSRAPREARGEMLEVGKTYTGVIEDMGKKGDGLLHIGKKVVFIPGTAVGDEVSFVVTEDMGRFAQGKLVPSGE